jgi:hypothetical protein
MAKVFEAATEQFLGYPRVLHVELANPMDCLALLRAKSMGVGGRAGIAETKQPSP